jgi:hypothetical protein
MGTGQDRRRGRHHSLAERLQSQHPQHPLTAGQHLLTAGQHLLTADSVSAMMPRRCIRVTRIDDVAVLSSPRRFLTSAVRDLVTRAGGRQFAALSSGTAVLVFMMNQGPAWADAGSGWRVSVLG